MLQTVLTEPLVDVAQHVFKCVRINMVRIIIIGTKYSIYGKDHQSQCLLLSKSSNRNR